MKRLLFAALLMLAFALAGCSSDDDSGGGGKGAPTCLSADADQNTMLLTVTWKAVDGAVEYIVYGAADGGTKTPIGQNC